MLAAMSYSLELMGSVLVGLGIGHATFFDLDYDLRADGGNGNAGCDGAGEEDEEVGDDADVADDGTTTPGSGGGGGGGGGGGNNGGNHAGNNAAAGAAIGAGTSSCCDVPGRGPPRRVFQFLRSPIPALAGVGKGRAISGPTEDGVDSEVVCEDEDAVYYPKRMAFHKPRNSDPDNLSLHEDDKMTPLL